MALGAQLPAHAKFVVGGDSHQSTPKLVAALVHGLCHAGLDVVDLGSLPTPMIYYAARRLRAEGCAIATASTHPAPLDRLTWRLHNRLPTRDDVTAMAQCREKTATNGKDRKTTTPRTLDVSFDYVACLQETFVNSLGAQRHIVLDPMHGCWSGRARRYLHAIFPQCLFSTIHDAANTLHGGNDFNGSRHADFLDLCDTVYRERAHLGIAFDGNGDRIVLVDNEGVVLNAEETAWVLLNCLGDELRGERFVCDQRFSDHIADAAQCLGAEPLIEGGDQERIRTRMIDSGAIFGAELNGRYFYRSLEYNDDGLYSACLLIEHLARGNRTLADLRRSCPAVYMTPDLCISVPADQQPAVIDQILAAWPELPQRRIDGVRLDFPGGWALMRGSPTDNAMTFRFEGLDWHALEDLVERFCDAMPEYGDELWTRYRAAVGDEGS
jgi:phosphomannomutase/phosphoglucomutase